MSKSNFRNFIVNESDAIENVPPKDSYWLFHCIFDTMSIMNDEEFKNERNLRKMILSNSESYNAA